MDQLKLPSLSTAISSNIRAVSISPSSKSVLVFVGEKGNFWSLVTDPPLVHSMDSRGENFHAVINSFT